MRSLVSRPSFDTVTNRPVARHEHEEDTDGAVRYWRSPPGARSASQCREEPARQRCDNGNPGVGPIRIALVVDGKQGVREAGAEIARRVDGVSGGAAQ